MSCKTSNCSITYFSLFLVLALAVLTGCASMNAGSKARISFTPVTSEPTDIYHPGKIVWHDLVTPDPAAARKFYGELFGWTFRDNGNYTEIFNGKKKIGGIVQLKPKKGQKTLAAWLESMSVPDVDEAVSYIKSKGGKVVNGPVDMPKRGRGALVQDPSGAYLVVLHAYGGDPPDEKAQIGEWLWNEMWTMYLETTSWFYKGLGQYESAMKGPDYVVFISEGKWRVGIRQIKQRDYSGRWVPVVRVKNPGAMLGRVKELGGIVLLKPGEGSASKDGALITDNTGALLILQRWTYPERKEP